MPRLNRIRVTNIKYDQGKKHLPDLLFETKGLDTLFILANGGGKSLLVQLFLQVILPNTRMGKRKIEDLLQSNPYTGHIVVEWLLDTVGERRQFLCTGFCFSRGSNNEQPLRYYNYLFEYDDQADLTIEQLPLITASEEEGGTKRPIQYQKFKDWLREEGVQPLDRPEIYQQRLKSYQILPEEWKNIRQTNGAEGGVDKFFEKSKSTRQLMDNLLIPAVEEMIFQDERKKQELVHAFTQYREMLLEIPVIKQNLQDFAMIRDAAQDIVNEVEVLHEQEKNFTAKTQEIVRLARSFSEFGEKAQKAIDVLEQEEEKLFCEHKEHDWQERSYEWFLRKLELEKAKTTEDTAKEDYAKAESLWQKAEEEENHLQALYYFNEAEQAEQERLKYQQRLELMEQAEPELQALLVEKKKILKKVWENRKTALIQEFNSEKEVLAKLEEEKESLIKEKEADKLKQRELTKKSAVVENWLEEYKNKRQDLLNLPEVETEDVLDSAASLEKRRATWQLYKQEEAKAIGRKGQLASLLEESEQKVFALTKEDYQLKTELNGVKEKLNLWQQEEDLLRGLLSERGIYLKSLLEEKEETIFRIKDLLVAVQEKKLGFQAELANLQEKWALVDGRDYYIPHHDLLKLKNRLERAGVYTALGSEWLAEQALTEAEKEAILQRQPFLPFALLLEKNQVNLVKNIVRQGKEWTCDLPLLFLVKSAEMIQGKEIGENFFPLCQDELYLFRPDTFKVYTSEDAFQGMKSRLQEKMELRNDEVKAEVEQERLLIGLQEKLADFYRQYSLTLVKDWEEEKTRLVADRISLEQRLKMEEEQKVRFKQETSDLEEFLHEIVWEKEKLKEIIGKFVEFNELHLLNPSKAGEQKNLAEQLQQVEAELTKIEERLVTISGEMVEKNTCLKELNIQQGEHERDFIKYQLTTIEPEENGFVGDYNYARMEVEGILARLNKKQSERENIQELLGKTVDQYQKAMFEVKKRGVAGDWLQQKQQPVNQEEIMVAGQTSKKYKRECEEKKEIWQEALSKTRSVQSLLEHIANGIRQDFSREPYTGFTEINHVLEIASLKERKIAVEKHLEKISVERKEKTEWQNEVVNAYELVFEIMPEEIQRLWTEVTPFTDEGWRALQAKPRRFLTKCIKERNERASEIEKQKNIVNQQFERYLHKLETTNNVKIKQFIRDVKVIMADQRLYDYDFVQDQFLRIFEGLEQYEHQYNNTLAECDKNKVHLVDLCLRRTESVYDSINEIPKNSRVRLYEHDLQVIRLDWRRRDEEDSRERLNNYLEQALVDLQAFKQEGKNDDEINRMMEIKLQTRNLIEQIAPIENCRVLVYKPRKETMLRYSKPEYEAWDEVPKWSGGEEYSVYMTMFMIMLTHIRQQLDGTHNVWKVLLADNPFGKASSSHVWEPVFQIAKANRLQLICFTAHKQEEILKRFPVVYSLQLRSAYGQEIMQAELMESGFYRLDIASGDGAQMMLPL